MSDAPTPSGATLLAEARTGQKDAIAALADRYQSHVFRFGTRLCGNQDDGADVAQETLLAMARAIDGFRGEAELTTWLYTIARRVCTKKRRRRAGAPVRVESLEALNPAERNAIAGRERDPERQTALHEVSAALDSALAALPIAQREVLLLRDVEGLSADETGQALGLSVAAVKSRLHRARRAIQVELRPILGPAPAPKAPDCPDVLHLLSRHLEGDLAPDACASMEIHLATCPRCDAACQSLRRALALCRNQPAPSMPPHLQAEVRRAIRAYLEAPPAPVSRRPGTPAGD